MLKTVILLMAAFVALVGSYLAYLAFGPVGRGERLFGATQESDYSEMETAIRDGADVDYLFDGSTSSLATAVAEGDAKAIAILLHHGASDSTLSGHLQRVLEAEPLSKKVAHELTALRARTPSK